MRRVYGLLFVCVASAVFAQTPKIGPNPVAVGKQKQDIYYIPPAGLPDVPNLRILLASGSEGWKGEIAGFARTISSWGYAVYGFDSRAYVGNVRALDPITVAGDMRQAGAWILGGTGRKAVFIGWGEGARIGVMALAEPDTQAIFSGLIAINLPEPAAPKLPQVTVPLIMISSSRNSPAAAQAEKELFENAREPKRLSVIDATDMYFGGNRRAFLDALRDGIRWIAEKSQ